MSVKVIALVTQVQAYVDLTDETNANTYQVILDVNACDGVPASGHSFHGSFCAAFPTRDMTINQINDCLIAAVIASVEASTPATTYSWVIDRNDVLVSGLLQRA